MENIKTFLLNEEGASGVEYGLLVALISAVVIVTVSSLGVKLNTKFTTVDGKL